MYEVIDAPPVNAGAVNATEAWATPAVPTTLVGAPGAAAVTVKDLVTVVAALYEPLPT